YDLARAVRLKLSPPMTGANAAPEVGLTTDPLRRATSEWIGLAAWPDIQPTWAYVLGKDNSAIESAQAEDRNAEELGFTASQSSEVVRAYMLAFAYAASRAADGKASVSVLDFGGALGLYSTVARLALPNKNVD